MLYVVHIFKSVTIINIRKRLKSSLFLRQITLTTADLCFYTYSSLNILQNISFCVPHKKESHIGLERLEWVNSGIIFFSEWTIPLKVINGGCVWEIVSVWYDCVNSPFPATAINLSLTWISPYGSALSDWHTWTWTIQNNMGNHQELFIQSSP